MGEAMQANINAVSSETLHVSTVAIGDVAVLIEGESGAGKSDLALRLIDRGARLVSDDYTLLQRQDGQLFASPPARIAGKIEVRGLGIVPMPFVERVPVGLLVRLAEMPERLPDRNERRWVAGVQVPEMAIDGRATSAAIVVELAVRHRDAALT